MQSVRLLEIPKCKMVSSGVGNIGVGNLKKFDEWFSSLGKTMFPKDFLWYDEIKGGFVWYYIYDEKMQVPEDFEVVDFEGGFYAVAAGIDGEDGSEITDAIEEFIEKSGKLEIDENRQWFGNIISPQQLADVIGYHQMDYYIPIKIKQ